MRVTIAIVCSAGFLAAAIVPVAADCPADLAKVEKATQSGYLQEAEVAGRQVNDSLVCAPWEQDKANALLSTRLITEARKIDPSLKQAQAAALIEKAAQPAVDWRSLELRGRLQRSAGKFREATES